MYCDVDIINFWFFYDRWLYFVNVFFFKYVCKLNCWFDFEKGLVEGFFGCLLVVELVLLLGIVGFGLGWVEEEIYV